MADQSDGTSTAYMLTTIDNPFNPFTQWDEWLAFDTTSGYNSTGLLDRITITSDELSEADQVLALQQAIEEIVLHDALGIYKKVSRNSFDSTNETVS